MQSNPSMIYGISHLDQMVLLLCGFDLPETNETREMNKNDGKLWIFNYRFLIFSHAVSSIPNLQRQFHSIQKL